MARFPVISHAAHKAINDGEKCVVVEAGARKGASQKGKGKAQGQAWKGTPARGNPSGTAGGKDQPYEWWPEQAGWQGEVKSGQDDAGSGHDCCVAVMPRCKR